MLGRADALDRPARGDRRPGRHGLSLTLLPALLLLDGRRAFWPLIPRAGARAVERPVLWARAGARIARRPRPVWIAGMLVLLVMAGGVVQLSPSLGTGGGFTASPRR